MDDDTRIKALGGIGILSRKDIHDFNSSNWKILELMIDGEWHGADEIRAAAGVGIPASEGLRRMRELRRHFTVDRRHAGGRLYEYRLSTTAKPLNPQNTLF